jgi:polyisoprenoid-binding protein YceI
MRLSAILAATWLLAASPTPASAAARQFPVTPPIARIGYTVFALGVLPVAATFDRFEGTVVQDPARPDDCQVRVTIDVASMRMDDPERRREALGADMLDAADFPTMQFDGACHGSRQAQSVVGKLTLHGVTRALTLRVQRNGTQVNCVGRLARGDFGILGMGDLVAPIVRIDLSLRLPP